MRRLEFTRQTRASAGRIKNSTEAVLALAHAGRERLRLQQERVALEKRIRRIEARLIEIAGTETKLAPVVQSQLRSITGAPSGGPPTLPRIALPPNIGEMTLQY